MRHNVLCLIIAFLAAVASLVLLPIVAFLLLKVFLPGLFEDDTLTWVLIFAGPGLLAILICLSVAAAVVAFHLAKARLPDRGWLSPQASAVLLPFAAVIAVAGSAAYLYFKEPPEIGPQQAGLPALKHARTLTPKEGRQSNWQLAWSADGARLASYNSPGIMTWSADGASQKRLPLFQNFPTSTNLRFLDGHRLLVTGPFTEIDSREDRAKLDDVAFSVVDAETGSVLAQIPGPHPGGRGPDNEAKEIALSPDERWVAVICGYATPKVNVFSTSDWKQVATLDLETGEKGDTLPPQGLAFSPDGQTLAVIHGLEGRIKFFKVESWTYAGSLITFPKQAPAMGVVTLGAIAISPNGALIAVGSSSGGAWWVDERDLPTWRGWGTLKQRFPADPLRVFQVADGKLVASLGSFSGGLSRGGLIWSPSGEYLAFHDAFGDIRFWSPFRPDLSVPVARGGERYANLQFSKNGSQLAANFSDGVRVFDVVPPR